MSGPGIVTLQSLRIQSQERADQLNASFLSTSEWNRNIMGSYKELYDLLVSAYGSDYYVNVPVTFTTDGTSSLYALPDGSTSFTNALTGSAYTAPAFYKLLGVDLRLSSSGQYSHVTIHRFNFADRNKGEYTLRYRLDGDKIWLTPLPESGQVIQLWYVPRPSDIQPEVTCGVTSASTTVTCTDTSNLATGMYVQAPGSLSMFPSGTTISTITANTSFVVSAAPTVTGANTLIRAWSEATTIDGISGWEEYVVIDAALKSMGKEESDVSVLAAQKLAMLKRLQDMAENRDAGSPATVVDVQETDFWQPPLRGFY